MARLGSRVRALAPDLGQLRQRRGNSARVEHSRPGPATAADRVPVAGTGERLSVNIVCYEDPHAWVLGKIARRLTEQLQRMGVRADLTQAPNPKADINHHVCYWSYDGRKSQGDTLMVTHIDTDEELRKLRHQLVAAEMAICMSSAEVARLADLGIPRERLCHINPGHDGLIQPRKVVIGITTRLYEDGRKRESMLLELAERVALNTFEFKIMGNGWAEIVAGLRQRGVHVDYWEHFQPGDYAVLIPSLDYYLYTGLDEGSMGFVDAVAAGVQTIVTPQGFHLDAAAGITHAFTTVEELQDIFEGIVAQRAGRVQAVAGWTFAENARRHLRLWEFLHGRRAGHPVSPELARDLADMSALW